MDKEQERNEKNFVQNCMHQGHPDNFKFIERFEDLRRAANSCNNINLSKGLAQIIISLKKYPLPVITVSQAESLLGVGSSFTAEFQRVLSGPTPETVILPGYKRELRGRLEQLAIDIGGFPAIDSDDESCKGEGVQTKKPRAGKYSPPVGSAAWAVLILMYLRSGQTLNRVRMDDIQGRMREFHSRYPKCTKFNEGTLKKLVGRALITMEGGGPFDGRLNILLTPLGYEVSSAIWQRSLRTENLRALLQLEDDNNGDEARDLILIVDTREFSILSILEAANVGFRYEQRSLPVGDFTWVWRSDKSDEYMAGCIVERKAIEDLSTSIKDGRYEEQRRRLARAPGIYQVIYVVEGTYSESAQRNPTLLPETSLITAIRHTELCENFSVLITTNVADTAQTLIEIHTRIMSKGFKKEEDSTTYRDFSQEIHKSNSLTIAQVTSKMLRSLPGIGDEAIMALHEFFVKTGKGGLTLANVASALTDPNINETIKSVTGAKRIPFSAPALAILRQQYSPA